MKLSLQYYLLLLLLMIQTLIPCSGETRSALIVDEMKSKKLVGVSESLRSGGGVGGHLPSFVRDDAAMQIIDNEDDSDDEVEIGLDEDVGSVKEVGGSGHDFLRSEFSPAK